MSTCHNAPLETDEVTLNHFIWCKVVYGTLEDMQCESNGTGCKVVGTLSMRMTMMGLGHQGSDADKDRSVRIWILLDDWLVSSPPPRMNLSYSILGVCQSLDSRTTCQRGTDKGDTKTFSGWMANGHTFFDFILPEGSVTTDDKAASADFHFEAEIHGNPIDKREIIGGPEAPGFRCDSSTAVHYKGCVFPNVVEQFWLKATPDVADEAAHIWKAQNKPDLTLPNSTAAKNIPGSRFSRHPLTRLTDPTLKSNNNKKSAYQCRKYWGSYSQGGTQECDEYPFQSTHQGSSTGGTGYAHFSVEVMPTAQNQAGGKHLLAFYNAQRIIEGDHFYVDVLKANGDAYGGSDAYPGGVVGPIENRSCNMGVPQIKEVTTNASPTSLFNNYARTTANGWTGGDSTYSVKLPDGRIIWVFSDTFLGPLNPDGTRPTSAGLVNSTFVVQNGSQLSTITGGSSTSPEAIMPPSEPGFWYWAGDAMISSVGGEKHLQVIYQEYRRFGDGAWDWGFNRNVVATFALNNFKEPVSINPLPSSAKVAWGSALLSSDSSGDGYTYIYGVSDAPTNKKMRVARVKGSNLANTAGWEFYDLQEGNWVRDERDGASSLTGIANEYSVTPWNGGFVLVSQDSTHAFSGRVRMWYGCSPYGPFTQPADDLVYQMPEPGPWGSYLDGNIISYNAHVHPTLQNGDRWTLSYNVNSMDSRMTAEGAHYRDPGIYKPRFVSFRIVPQ